MTEATPVLTNHRIFTLTRVFDAPRDRVFRAWTEPDQFATWWGGKDAVVPADTIRMDLRDGGEWFADMVASDGSKHPFAGVYQKVSPPDSLVMTLSEGDRPDPERQHILTVLLADVGGKTEMTFSQKGDFGEEPDAMIAGLNHGYGEFFSAMEDVVMSQ